MRGAPKLALEFPFVEAASIGGWDGVPLAADAETNLRPYFEYPNN
ncbi:MAG TPA: hypothetical protein VMF04_01230 [Thermoplasmata archaeon]|nr:hypothetical protein [Thermoplasmata archaeon]